MAHRRVLVENTHSMYVDEKNAEDVENSIESLIMMSKLLGYAIKTFTFPIGKNPTGRIVLEFKMEDDDPRFWLEFLLDDDKIAVKSSLLFYDDSEPIRSYNLLEPINQLAILL